MDDIGGLKYGFLPRPGKREVDGERRTYSDARLHTDGAGMGTHHTEYGRQSQPGTFSLFLGGEERLENPRKIVVSDPGSGISYVDAGIVPGVNTEFCEQWVLRFKQLRRCPDRKRSAFKIHSLALFATLSYISYIMERGKKGSAVPFYHARDPFASPFWQVVDEYYDEFEQVYSERYEKTYGFWRPVIGDVVGKFLICGDLREGFARVRCKDCGDEHFVAFSCKQRLFCPCCAQKRILELAIHTQEDVCEAVQHRQFVFTMPKRLRIYFRYDRDLLKELPKLAWQVIKEVCQSVLDRPDAVPGMIATVQTFGELAHWHPHVHTIVTDGLFTPDGTFLPLPKLPLEPFQKLWEQRLFALLLKHSKITQTVVDQMRSWRHSGFSVHKDVVIAVGDSRGLQNLIQYIARCPFSIGRMLKVTDNGQVIYRTEHGGCYKFPKPADRDLKAAPARNFQVFDPLDFLAEVTQHIPQPRAHTIRYFGWYSNKARGMRAKQAKGDSAEEPQEMVIDCEDTPYRKTCRSRWAALIKRVYETDPLCCPKCGGEMRFVAFIEKRDQADVIEKILKHCDLWREPKRSTSPGIVPDGDVPFALDPEYIPFDEFIANF